MTDEELYYKVFPDGCWHKLSRGVFGEFYDCSCGEQFHTEEGMAEHIHGLNPDFTTWEGFGILFEGMKKRDDWGGFCTFLILQYNEPQYSEMQDVHIVGISMESCRYVDLNPNLLRYLVHPTRFRDACKAFFERE